MKTIRTSTLLLVLLLSACATPLSYEEQVNAYNAGVAEQYTKCFAGLNLPDDGGFMSTIGDGLCTFSHTAEDKNGNQCFASYRRLTTMFSSKKSCEPYHAISDSNGTLMLETRHNDLGEVIKVVPSRNLTQAEQWTGDLWCRSRGKSRAFSDLVFSPYELARNTKKRRNPRPDEIGWTALFKNGEVVDLKNRRQIMGYQQCQIVWRYNFSKGRHNAVLAKLGYF